MIYNHACSHCRKKLRRSFRNAYMANSPIKQRKASHSSSTGSVISNTSRPWLNERLLKAFDEPFLPDLLLSSPSPQADVYNPGGTGYFDCMAIMQNPNIIFDQMLQNMGNTFEIGEFEIGIPSMCPGVNTGCNTEALETDILSPEARAQLQIASELDKFPSGDWWESWPSASMSDGLITPSSSISSPIPCFSELGSGFPMAPLIPDSSLFEDPFLSTVDSSLLDSVFGPSSRPDFQKSSTTRSSDNSERKRGRKFTFIYENPGARTQQ